MRRTTVLCVAVVVAVAAVPMPTAAQNEQVTLTVTVVNQADERVGGATITASWDGGNTTETTRSNGQALIDVPRGAEVELDVTSDQYVRNQPYVIESADGQRVEVGVAQKGSATVTVFDTDGDRLSNAVVRLWQGGTPVVNARTDENGMLETPTIEQGEYRLVVFREGYFRNRTDLQVDGDVSESMQIESGSVSVTFDVTDDRFDSPRPVQDARISIEGITSGLSTLQNGETSTTVPVNDNYDVTVTKENYTEASRTVRVDEQPKTVNFSINRAPELNITPSADRVVTGEPVSVRITNEYGNPISDVSVMLDGNTVGETDGEGRLTLTVEGEGEHTIAASHEGMSTEYTIQGFSGTTATATATETSTAAETTEPSSGFGPGFGLPALLAAVLALALIARRRD
jgi:hypothetical protein